MQEKYLNTRAQPGLLPCILVLDHLKPDFNIGKIFRSADAFGCREVWLVGVKWFDPAPGKGSFKHVPARFFEAYAQAHAALLEEGYTAYRLEPEDGPVLWDAEITQPCALVLGNEGVGMSFSRAQFPGVLPLRIPQSGRAQSLNVAVAASVALYEMARRSQVSDPGIRKLHDRLHPVAVTAV